MATEEALPDTYVVVTVYRGGRAYTATDRIDECVSLESGSYEEYSVVDMVVDAANRVVADAIKEERS